MTPETVSVADFRRYQSAADKAALRREVAGTLGGYDLALKHLREGCSLADMELYYNLVLTPWGEKYTKEGEGVPSQPRQRGLSQEVQIATQDTTSATEYA